MSAARPNLSDIDPVDERIGNNIHDLLRRSRHTQRALAPAVGVTESTLSKKMRGAVGWSSSEIQQAADFLGVDPGRLFKEVTLPKHRTNLTKIIGGGYGGSLQIPLLLSVPTL